MMSNVIDYGIEQATELLSGEHTVGELRCAESCKITVFSVYFSSEIYIHLYKGKAMQMFSSCTHGCISPCPSMPKQAANVLI